MGYLVRMPQMGMEMDRGEVVAWEVDEGEEINEGEVVAVVESEKATNEVEAREDGVLRRVLVPEGEPVEPGTSIGILAGPDEDLSQFADELDSQGAAETVDGSERTGTERSASATPSATDAEATGDGPTGSERGEDVRATPGAKRLADERTVDLTAIGGTGPQGVVTEDDVESHLDGTGRPDTGGTADSAPNDATAVDGESADGAAVEDVRATPGARELAGEAGVDLTAVEGTGPQGVVTEDDVEARAGGGADASAEDGIAAGGGADGVASRTVREVRELSGMQETVGDRLGESYRNAVHVTVKRSFDAGRLRGVTAAAGAAGAEVSLTDVMLRIVGTQLDAQPAFNALYEDGEHRLIEEVNVGVAVDVDDGLVTPVVPSMTERTVEAVARIRGEHVDRATAGAFTADDLSGGTFTVSNLGPFGVDSFDPVINPPEVAILGVGRVREDGSMTLSLSFDHRVVNGADAARFLDGLVGRLTDPAALDEVFAADIPVEALAAIDR